MLKSWLIILFSTAVIRVGAQHMLPDSLRKKYADIPQDSNYVNTLNKVASDFLRTNPEVSRSICSHVLEVASRVKYERGYARALTVMGSTYWYEGIYEFAQNYYLLAARQYQSIRDNRGLGETYNNIGEVYKRLNEYEKALEYLTRSSELIRNDSASQALILYNIGELYIHVNKIDKAKQYINRSYDLAKALNNRRIIAFNYWSLAAIKLKEENYAGALAYFFDAEKIWKETGEIRSLIQTYQDIAEVYREQKEYKLTEKYLDKAIELAGIIKVPDLQVNNYLRYARLDSMRGNYEQALYHLSRHNVLKDSVYNIRKAEQIARLQTIYETESREHENKQLRLDTQLKESELASQRITLATISAGLILAGVLAWILYRQRKKILFQKNAIEVQATALLQLNAELQKFNKTLEARINERTSQLTVQNQRLTEYTFINAHKLRAPVASILGLINLLHHADLADRDVVLGHLKTCGEELDNIIHEVSRSLEDAIVKDSENV
jgi:tetratricopeptide (TPR) repeat protein